MSAPKNVFRQGVSVFMSNRLAVVGLSILIAFTLFSFVGPYVWVTEQQYSSLSDAYLPLSSQHPLGTDGVGFDQLGRLMEGGKTSIIIGLAAGILATTIGTIWGAIAGFIGGWVDSAMMRIVDAMMAVPALFLFILIASVITPNVPLLVLTIGAFAWLNPARLIRGESLALRSREYIVAMRGMGGSPMRAVRTHIVRNAIGTVIVNATFQVADAILYVAYLSFLGLGVPPPAANWGGMLSTGMNEVYNGHWWLLYPPGIMIIMLVVAFNFVGDGLRDAFEVRLRSR
ncbi:ABC transporter permease [Arcanobacterium haemolyticum]|uniref:Binding-protein-dependent transport systems inner membrane component n=1 Tax=Arcanobacterium haemolyticum (strain ATCC 9345 / DSM 20595 / CCM 5947 / CCUG 17215 / LMG 16163 / NBRC 15585 / NCTC 8452 / 11018) TaxID=644284 RepID=D7BLM2_ARCHD|nr:ABC transporter permease [Arcanobacterium haemolyticum]ADH91821.1 binding-protein-dependent transport systems inner membrane component [Arcanobacterium haemolyticum DSM 20595]QCX46023.1 ABC transporter permease [Arcanobacterium haemolyticum]SPT74690.1 Oligopeptide transport system permease protein oppC [Arcanobacterium haemolyticum]SQH27333.1 Oligopeptide transport system permease protein oppC [Arcanobacterium haemolyticum]